MDRRPTEERIYPDDIPNMSGLECGVHKSMVPYDGSSVWVRFRTWLKDFCERHLIGEEP